MTDQPAPGSRSISVAGNVTGSALITGNQNRVDLSGQRINLPEAESVDIRAELNAVRELLVQLNAPDQRRIDNAFGEAEDELNKEQPDKDELGKALDRALFYAKKAESFGKIIAVVQPHVINTVAWLGQNWHSLLAAVGVAAAG